MVPAAGNAGHYAEIVQQNSLLRRLLGATQEIQRWIADRSALPRELADRAAPANTLKRWNLHGQALVRHGLMLRVETGQSSGPARTEALPARFSAGR